VKLSELKPGEMGVIIKVGGAGAIRSRLLSMGILPGAVIRVVRLSPLGDPIEYEIRGVFISLRKLEAEKVEVDKVVPLYMIPPGHRVKVITLDGGMGFIRNMGTIGIAPGKEVVVERGCCPMMVQTERGVFQLGRGESYRVYVR
jgi:ferrous iron transport protein A